MTLSVTNITRKLNIWEEALLKPNEADANLSSLQYLFNDKALASRVEFLGRKDFNRQNIYGLLADGNSDLSLSSNQTESLEKIKHPRSCFVVTGQQPGLLGGPIFWYYKALTAIKASKELEKNLGIPVIPLFWIAGDDSDLRECNRLELLEILEGRTVFSLQQENNKRLIPMSERKLGGSIYELVNKLSGQWSNDVMEITREVLNEDFSFSGSFRCLAQKFLGQQGVLFVDGNSEGFRTHTSTVMKKIIKDWKIFEQLLNESAEAIKSHEVLPTVSFRPDTVHAFIKKDSERVRIFNESEKTFRTGNEKLTRDEIYKELSSMNITHDVVSRPILIDSIFPVLGHILGPNELGYFNQLPEVFKHFTGDSPLVCPRMTALVLKSDQIKRMKEAKFEIDELQGLKNSEMRNRLIEQTWRDDGGGEETFEELFEKYFGNITAMSKQVIPDNTSINTQTSEDFIKNIRRVWLKHLKRLKRLHFHSKSHQYTQHFSDVHWLANGSGQDRHLNILSLLNMLGSSDMEEFTKAINPLEMKHQIISVEKSSQ